MEHAEDERGPHLKIDWGINDIRMLHDSVSFYRDKGEIDFDKHSYEREHLDNMKRVLNSMILEFNYFKLNSD